MAFKRSRAVIPTKTKSKSPFHGSLDFFLCLNWRDDVCFLLNKKLTFGTSTITVKKRAYKLHWVVGRLIL